MSAVVSERGACQSHVDDEADGRRGQPAGDGVREHPLSVRQHHARHQGTATHMHARMHAHTHAHTHTNTRIINTTPSTKVQPHTHTRHQYHARHQGTATHTHGYTVIYYPENKVFIFVKFFWDNYRRFSKTSFSQIMVNGSVLLLLLLLL